MKTLLSARKSLIGPASFYKQALAIALPVMAQLLIQNMVSLIDNFMVAGLGDIKMSGVNIAGQINFVFLVFINTICSSGGIFMSQYNGAKDPDGMQQTFRFKILMCTVAGIAYTAISFFCPRPFLALMVHGNSESAPIIEEGVKYMRVLAFSWIPAVLAIAIGSSLREIGKVRPPLVISIAATAVNTFFNWIFIYGNLGAPRLEVEGAAIATIIARVTEITAFVVFIRKVRPPFFSRMRQLIRIKAALFFTILRKSALILISEMMWVLSETITTALYNSRGGADVVSGMAAGFAIANLFFVCFSGIFTVTGVILGGTLGANKLEEARVQKNWLLSGAAMFGVGSAVLGCMTVLLIPVVYGNLSAAAQTITRGLVLVNAAYMPIWAFVNGQFAISRTGGDTTMGVIVDVSVNGLIVVPGMFALTYLTPLGPVAMYAVIKISDFVKMAICSVWLKKERWVKNLTTMKK